MSYDVNRGQYAWSSEVEKLRAERDALQARLDRVNAWGVKINDAAKPRFDTAGRMIGFFISVADWDAASFDERKTP